MSSALYVYLAVYNQALGLGWLAILATLLARGSCVGAWSAIGTLAVALQALVLLDVVHAALGMWPETPIGLLQRLWCKVGHRAEVCVTLVIAWLRDPRVLDSWPFGFLLLTWALADVSRYQLYFLRGLGKQPPCWLAWLRYSDFLLQYPLVIISEAIAVSTVHLTSRGCNLFLAAAGFTIAVTAALPRLKFTTNVPLALSVLAAAALAPIVPGYGAVGLAFQVYEWLIFVPAYAVLWKERQRRLGTATSVDSVPASACEARLRNASETLTKRKDHLQFQIENEKRQALALKKLGRKSEALACMRRKKVCEKQLEQLSKSKMAVDAQCRALDEINLSAARLEQSTQQS